MLTIKPAGADLWRRFFFTSKDGSGRNFGQTACFAFTDVDYHKLYRGPAIASVSSAVDALITTAEEHGFQVGEDVRHHGLPSEFAALNASFTILTVPSPTTYTVGFDSGALAAIADIGIAGRDVGTKISVDDYGLVAGALVRDGHPEFWQLPLDY